jgi:hypothetical protein
LPGTSCDDGNGDTENDVFDANCICIGEDCLGVLGGSALPGTPCDDGDSTTVDDTWATGCICVGEVGIAEERNDHLITISPNPTRDVVRITIEALRGEEVLVTLRNALGETFIEQDLGELTGDRQQLLDISGLSTGIYFVEVTIGDQRSVKRVSKF